MPNQNLYYNVVDNKKEKSVNINIFGDISGFDYDWTDSTGIKKLSRRLEDFNDYNEINVYINSYGGELAEGLAIYNALKLNKATVNTYNIGFACSSASIVFMAGDNRYMSKSSILMIHNVSQFAYGNSQDFKKIANDLEILNTVVLNSYLDKVALTEKELTKMMDKETFIDSDDALNWGFITNILEDTNTSTSNSLKAIKNHLCIKASNKHAIADNEFNNAINTALTLELLNNKNAENSKENLENLENSDNLSQKKENEIEKEAENEEEETSKINFYDNFINAIIKEKR